MDGVIDAKIMEFREAMARNGEIRLNLLPTGSPTSTDTNALGRFLFTTLLFDSKVKFRLWPTALGIMEGVT